MSDGPRPAPPASAARGGRFRRAWVTDVELGAPPADLRAPAGEGHDLARVLVRLHGHPLGFVQRPLRDGVLAARDVVEAAAQELAGPLDDHLAADGLSRADLGGGPAASDPPCGRPGPHGSPAPFVSVLISTRDRADSLRRVLTTLDAVDYPHFEVVLVDNAPKTDATARVVQERADPRVRYVLEPRAGLSRARNRGVAECRGDVVAFTDDDVLVDPGWLRALARGFTRAPHVGLVTGLVPAAELETESQHFFEEKVSWAARPAARLYDLAEHALDDPVYPYSAGIFGTGANFAASREALDAIGPFDEALGAGAPAQGGEDLDYFLRALLAGRAIAYEPSALVWHVHRRDAASLHRQMFGYGSGLSAYAAKHLLDRRTRADILGRVPRSVLRLGRAAHAGTQSAGLPPALLAQELRGLAQGPWLYARGRRAARGRGPRGRA